VSLFVNLYIPSSSFSFSTFDSFDMFAFGPCVSLIRDLSFSTTKRDMMAFLVQTVSSKARLNEDEYDYPEDLPQITLNRAAARKAKDCHEKENSLFFQLKRELQGVPYALLRYGYTHPMDDGQPRTFRVKFDGEGVDDYGGPYREVFFALTEELCSLNQNRKSIECFLPLLMPSPNWFHGVGSTERNSFLFKPTSSGTKEEHHSNLFFLGQVLGIAIRSQIYLKLPLASFTWDRLAEEEGVERSLEQRIQALTDHTIRRRVNPFILLSGEISCSCIINFRKRFVPSIKRR
jgi:hypothetical protein